MEPSIYKVISQGEVQQYQKQDGSMGRKCPITLQEFGAYKDDAMFACVLIGNAAGCRFQPGDTVAARLRFTAHLHEGRTYQDIFIMGIMKVNN